MSYNKHSCIFVVLQSLIKKIMKNIKQMEEIVSQKVESFIDTLIEDTQDVIQEDVEGVLEFNHGILPPRFKELKEELKGILNEYYKENLVIDQEYVNDFV